MKQVSEDIWLLGKSAKHLDLGGCQIFCDDTYSVKCSNTWLSSTRFGGISSLHYPCEAVDGSLVSGLPAVFVAYSFIST